MSGPGEFELIRDFFAARFQGSAPEAGVVLGIGDDCALLTPPAGKTLATSVDTLVAGVHFPATADPYRIASRALRVNLSDLAAMNAQPLWFTLALTLPESNADWLAGFAEGLADTAKRFDVQLVGGDTTKGPLAITIQVTGACDRPLRRDGASAGDSVFVSNRLGAAAAALPIVLGEVGGSEIQRQQMDASYYFPEPQFTVASAIGGYASAALDISDGLLADLAHICEASGLGAELDLNQVPVAELAQTMSGDQARTVAVTGGDDYQLCFTVPQQHLPALNVLNLPITCIGTMTRERGIRCTLDGEPWTHAQPGYRHF
ncbi:thiamine-phosphate kinase [Microbulbifer bruguierae]|uniref:Thiamine-monophosphate kinase n=1 Tax=Microbulbifer bruguierae TaxID=3029061 RepID=A0ABY8NBN8_9GAMM|nr:thiamine-phosphate kinase [Microbulbifer bruguierae]WGL16105.1 thiamine-phosphate kinase [Microbulbifer bruguierae]